MPAPTRPGTRMALNPALPPCTLADPGICLRIVSQALPPSTLLILNLSSTVGKALPPFGLSCNISLALFVAPALTCVGVGHESLALSAFPLTFEGALGLKHVTTRHGSSSRALFLPAIGGDRLLGRLPRRLFRVFKQSSFGMQRRTRKAHELQPEHHLLVGGPSHVHAVGRLRQKVLERGWAQCAGVTLFVKIAGNATLSLREKRGNAAGDILVAGVGRRQEATPHFGLEGHFQHRH
mmetsp:Transcript_20882/g.39235  ORF Transcript_20882/g.39235 Transcript_20882/m.39235 type:complete len:237 (-) Transcript_20882:87-797(-)